MLQDVSGANYQQRLSSAWASSSMGNAALQPVGVRIDQPLAPSRATHALGSFHGSLEMKKEGFGSLVFSGEPRFAVALLICNVSLEHEIVQKDNT